MSREDWQEDRVDKTRFILERLTKEKKIQSKNKKAKEPGTAMKRFAEEKRDKKAR